MKYLLPLILGPGSFPLGYKRGRDDDRGRAQNNKVGMMILEGDLFCFNYIKFSNLPQTFPA